MQIKRKLIAWQTQTQRKLIAWQTQTQCFMLCASQQQRELPAPAQKVSDSRVLIFLTTVRAISHEIRKLWRKTFLIWASHSKTQVFFLASLDFIFFRYGHTHGHKKALFISS
jgi:hypothetical protein